MRKTIVLVTTLAMALGVSGSSALAAEPVDPNEPLNRHAVWMKWFRGDRDVIDEKQYADTLMHRGPAKIEYPEEAKAGSAEKQEQQKQRETREQGEMKSEQDRKEGPA